MPDSTEPTTPVPLLVPADGVPPVIETAAGVRDAAERLAAGTGPLAVDAERASASVTRRAPTSCSCGGRGPDRSCSTRFRPRRTSNRCATRSTASNGFCTPADQDLPCLAELGLEPAALFDTELAGRLAGFERVGLAAIVERTLGLELRKGHGAADWSTRPLPDAWLNYAALDVEVLLDCGRRWRRNSPHRARLNGPHRNSSMSGWPTASTQAGPLAPDVTDPQPQEPAPARRGPGTVDHPRRDRAQTRHLPQPHPAGLGNRHRRERRPQEHRHAAGLAGVRRAPPAQVVTHLAGRARACSRPAPERTAPGQPAVHRTAATESLGQARSRRRGATGHGEDRDRRTERTRWGTRREPAEPGPRSPGLLEPPATPTTRTPKPRPPSTPRSLRAAPARGSAI